MHVVLLLLSWSILKNALCPSMFGWQQSSSFLPFIGSLIHFLLAHYYPLLISEIARNWHCCHKSGTPSQKHCSIILLVVTNSTGEPLNFPFWCVQGQFKTQRPNGIVLLKRTNARFLFLNIYICLLFFLNGMLLLQQVALCNWIS